MWCFLHDGRFLLKSWELLFKISYLWCIRCLVRSNYINAKHSFRLICLKEYLLSGHGQEEAEHFHCHHFFRPWSIVVLYSISFIFISQNWSGGLHVPHIYSGVHKRSIHILFSFSFFGANFSLNYFFLPVHCSSPTSGSIFLANNLILITREDLCKEMASD